jgi:hypothetical protein
MRVMNKLLTATATVGLLLSSGSAQADEGEPLRGM